MGELGRVQTLIQKGVSEVPPQYIQPPENRPRLRSKPTVNIPEIDLSAENHAVIEAIRGACRDWGAFHVLNHEVPIQLLDQMRKLPLSFFNEFPMEEKLKYACDPNSAASEGYGSRMLLSSEDDSVLDWRDYFDHHTLPLSHRNPSHWPHNPSEYRGVVAKYSDEMKVLAQRLLGIISESLGLKPSCIEDQVGEFYQNITVSYYPPCPQPELTLGLQTHSDFGAITLLIQDEVGGLQVLKDGEWVLVHPLPHAIVVLLSDQTEIITNGKYRSGVHRAITNNSRARLSVATFHDPAKARRISPASDLVSESSPPRYSSVVYGDYVSSWYSKGPEGRRNLDALRIDDDN